MSGKSPSVKTTRVKTTRDKGKKRTKAFHILNEKTKHRFLLACRKVYQNDPPIIADTDADSWSVEDITDESTRRIFDEYDPHLTAYELFYFVAEVTYCKDQGYQPVEVTDEKYTDCQYNPLRSSLFLLLSEMYLGEGFVGKKDSSLLVYDPNEKEEDYSGFDKELRLGFVNTYKHEYIEKCTLRILNPYLAFGKRINKATKVVQDFLDTLGVTRPVKEETKNEIASTRSNIILISDDITYNFKDHGKSKKSKSEVSKSLISTLKLPSIMKARNYADPIYTKHVSKYGTRNTEIISTFIQKFVKRYQDGTVPSQVVQYLKELLNILSEPEGPDYGPDTSISASESYSNLCKQYMKDFSKACSQLSSLKTSFNIGSSHRQLLVNDLSQVYQSCVGNFLTDDAKVKATASSSTGCSSKRKATSLKTETNVSDQVPSGKRARTKNVPKAEAGSSTDTGTPGQDSGKPIIVDTSVNSEQEEVEASTDEENGGNDNDNDDNGNIETPK